MTSRRQGLARKAVVGLLAGLLGGLLLGLGGRLAMRVIGTTAGLAPGFSPGGSLEVLATGLLIGTPAGLVYAVVRSYLRFLGAWKGAAFGALVFLALVLVPPPAARSAVAGVGELTLTLLLFGALFIAFGAAVEILVRRLTPEEKQP